MVVKHNESFAVRKLSPPHPHRGIVGEIRPRND